MYTSEKSHTSVKYVTRGVQFIDKLKVFRCLFCGKTFPSLGKINNHVLTHTGQKPHQCEICHKRFTEKGTLRKHLKTMHI
ncbi:PRDM1-like protein [Mya arenaria]|uniref:PRDM1-like protein n=1 Tax=Mya arenaria TaxID=6604 RepID=A0ABY7FFZ8_MYAAR|nr:PRDM1-like protein [Mya arenaria]